MVDCCGLVLQVYKKFGYTLPWTVEGYGNVVGQKDLGTEIINNIPSKDYSNLQEGDLIVFHGHSGNTWHIGIYSGNGYVINAQSSGVKEAYLSNYWYQYAVGVRRILTSNGSSTLKPEAISITTSLYNNKIDNYVKFDFEYINAEWAAIVIRKDGINKHVETVTGKNTYSHKFTEPGHYDIHLELWKGDDCSTKAIDGGINVYDSRPSNVTITPNKTHIIQGEKIDFSFTQKDASYWYFIVTKDGVRECLELMTGKYSTTYTFTDEGVYEVQIQTANDYGYTIVPVYITVSDEYKPTSTIEWNGHTYSLYDYRLSWNEAKELCEELGGHLVTIESAEDNEIIYNLIQSGESKYYWLGASDIQEDKKWKWINGNQFWQGDAKGYPVNNEYVNWGIGEPNGTGEEYTCVCIYKSTGMWDDTYCSHTQIGFICEIEEMHTESTVKVNNTTHKVETKVYNIDTQCELIVVGYKNGRLVDMKNTTYNNESLITSLEGDIDEIKVMAWDSVYNLKPLCEAEVIPMSEWI